MITIAKCGALEENLNAKLLKACDNCNVLCTGSHRIHETAKQSLLLLNIQYPPKIEYNHQSIDAFYFTIETILKYKLNHKADIASQYNIIYNIHLRYFFEFLSLVPMEPNYRSLNVFNFSQLKSKYLLIY